MHSMTGYGQARARDAQDSVDVEVRSVNHRYLKVHTHLAEAWASREPEVEEAVRDCVKRGTVDVDVKVTSKVPTVGEPFDKALIRQYWKNLKQVQTELGIPVPVSMDALLALPGVVRPMANTTDSARVWPKVLKTLKKALEDLNQSRKREGERLRKPLKEILKKISELLAEIKEEAPSVVVGYRDRLSERLGRLVNGSEAPIAPADLGRELALFADRCDISEEIARQESHVKEFDGALTSGGDVGRRLDFISQEMLREANTMGAKANDIRLSQRIISMKAEIEKIKEQIQNIE